MERKILIAGISFAVFFFVISSIGVSNAQNNTATPPGSLIRDAVQNRIQTAQERRQEVQEERSARKAEFKEKLQTIKDEVKKKVVERIDSRLEAVNQKVTDRFSAILDKLEEILRRLAGRAQDAKLQGKDTGEVDLAIGSAQAAIDNVKIAVASQAANLYVIEIASESALRIDVGSVVSLLRSDLKDVHKLIVEAKQAVQNVVMELAKLRGGNLEEENTATSSSL